MNMPDIPDEIEKGLDMPDGLAEPSSTESVMKSLLDNFMMIPTILKEATTYCFELAKEVLIRKTQHFTRISMNYTADGLEAMYTCSIDGRTYHVKVTPIDKKKEDTHAL